MNEDENLSIEIRSFSHLLNLLFRTLLLNSSDELLSIVNQTTQHDLSSKELLDFQQRLQTSQDRIAQLRFLRKHFHYDTFEQVHQLNSIKAQFMEEKSRSQIALRYSNDWKNNHLLQWIEMLEQFERNSIETIRQYERIVQQSNIAHEQTMNILVEQRNQLKTQADQWYEQYQNETSRFERELNDFRYEFKQLKQTREDLSDEYQRMKTIVDEYHQMKIQENLLLEKQKREEQSIVRIQTWWRGILVRRLKKKKKKRKKQSTSFK